MSNLIKQAEALRQAITPFIERIIDEKTKECLRTYKAKVITAPNSSTGKCSVQLIGQDTILELPYSSAVSSITKGEMVWVATTYNSWRNAVVWQKIDFK